MFQRFLHGVIGMSSVITLGLLVLWMEKNPAGPVHLLIVIIAGVGGLVALHGLAECS